MESQIFLPPDLPRHRADINQPTSQTLFWTEIDAAEAPVVEDYRSPSSFLDGLVLVGWGFSFSILIVLAVRKIVFFKLNAREVKSPDRSQTTPCSQCRYFSKNPYIKCAVNPLVVQKIEANDCSDFYANDC
ncbi:hypothetical protein [Nodosilinea sp. E11]|uniref:hypothetical protein n=1 Tax=Nodosilinea sp. E11 TaxID=3037479 RepID=UPI002935163A|nr:hypothetical protein [Nodosilinea sp. E11]WOD37893.1 hypothetical protein RRF56_16905 [Nodosilinea sp. E11]